jgi:hypothetical protein
MYTYFKHDLTCICKLENNFGMKNRFLSIYLAGSRPEAIKSFSLGSFMTSFWLSDTRPILVKSVGCGSVRPDAKPA